MYKFIVVVFVVRIVLLTVILFSTQVFKFATRIGQAY